VRRGTERLDLVVHTLASGDPAESSLTEALISALATYLPERVAS
jgi:hypothetical protein